MRPTGLWALLTLYSRLDQKEMSNEFWFIPSQAPDLTTWSGNAAALAITTNVQTALYNQASIKQTYVGGNLLFNDGTGTLGFDSYVTSTGQISGTYLPEDCSVLVQKDTESFRPGENGRWYFSGVPDTFATGSYLNGVGIPAWATALPQLMTSFVDQAITYQPAHWSPSNNTLKPIISVQTVGLLATRRRRRFRF